MYIEVLVNLCSQRWPYRSGRSQDYNLSSLISFASVASLPMIVDVASESAHPQSGGSAIKARTWERGGGAEIQLVRIKVNSESSAGCGEKRELEERAPAVHIRGTRAHMYKLRQRARPPAPGRRG